MQHIELKNRRKKIFEFIGNNAIAIFQNNPEQQRNSDVFHPFRSDSDFYYLTGFNEPNAIAVLTVQNNIRQYHLFCEEKDSKKELWNGVIIGTKNAVSIFGADKANSLKQLTEKLTKLLAGKAHIFYNIGVHHSLDKTIFAIINNLKNYARSSDDVPQKIISPDSFLHEMRLKKSSIEIQKIKHAITVTEKAHIRAMKSCKPLMNEYELEAEILYEFNKSGAKSPAYPSIVAGGANTCILHYTNNNQPLYDGDLVLIDAGCESDCYASDVTRTFPVNGKFSEAQREIYQIVLNAQEKVISIINPKIKWDELHQASVQEISKGLLKLGILSGDLSEIIKTEQYKPFFMHKTGHWLGMDVHDVGDYKIGQHYRILKPGMVFTIEPGIYISKTAKVAEKYRGIGVRIEDNILITTKGCEVLTKKIPKTIKEIEAIMCEKHI